MNRTVLALVDDLFWRTKIEHAVTSAQRKVTFLSDPSELSGADPENVGLVFVDLSCRKEPFDALKALKKTGKGKRIPVVAFYEHVRKDLQQKGEAAGCDEVLTRSVFSGRMGDLVLKYLLPGSVIAVEEESELPEE
jgi:CheY-like chemotaxis protein